MSWLSKNLSLVKKFDLQLYQRVQNCLAKKDQPQYCKLLEARNGELTMRYKDDINDKYILSSFNPTLQGEKWAQEQKEAEVYIVYGLGLGYHLPYFDREDVKKIFVIEPSMEIFILALDSMDLEWLLTSTKYVLSIAAEKKDILRGIANVIHISYSKKLELVAFPSYVALFSDKYLSLEKHINEAIGNSIIKFNTYRKFAKSWTNNFFKNLYVTLKAHKVIGLFNKFLDMPIIIISAGPSLTKNVHLLNDLKEKAVLICVGTAYKALKAHNIKPDFIVSFDGGIANYWQFAGIEIEDVPLIFDPIIYPQIIEEYKGKLISANIANGFFSWMERQLGFETGKVSAGPSVANIAFDLARKFGGDPIIFVGQDLAYTDGKSHAAGTVYENLCYKSTGSTHEVMVEDVFGNSVCTSRSWLSFLRWFERAIKDTKDKTFIDATEGGAKIEGTEIMSLQEVIDKYCTTKYKITETIENFFIQYAEPDKDFFLNAITALETISNEILEFEDKSSEGLEILNKLENLYKTSDPDQQQINCNLQKLDEIDQALLNFRDGKVFLQIIFQPLVLSIINSEESKAKPKETKAEMQTRIINFSRKLYIGIRDISELVLKMIHDAKEDFVQP